MEVYGVLLMRWRTSYDALEEKRRSISAQSAMYLAMLTGSQSRGPECARPDELSGVDRKSVCGVVHGGEGRINTTKGSRAARKRATIWSEETHETLRTAQVGDCLSWSPAPPSQHA